jgi:hypothetical protein
MATEFRVNPRQVTVDNNGGIAVPLLGQVR